jgi:hypothetical protein
MFICYIETMNTPQKKIDQLSALMQAGQWEQAIKFAAKFPKLGKHKEAITRASSAILSPEMYRSMDKDPECLVAYGIEALKERYPKHI